MSASVIDQYPVIDQNFLDARKIEMCVMTSTSWCILSRILFSMILVKTSCSVSILSMYLKLTLNTLCSSKLDNTETIPYHNSSYYTVHFIWKNWDELLDKRTKASIFVEFVWYVCMYILKNKPMWSTSRTSLLLKHQ